MSVSERFAALQKRNDELTAEQRKTADVYVIRTLDQLEKNKSDRAIIRNDYLNNVGFNFYSETLNKYGYSAKLKTRHVYDTDDIDFHGYDITEIHVTRNC